MDEIKPGSWQAFVLAVVVSFTATVAAVYPSSSFSRIQQAESVLKITANRVANVSTDDIKFGLVSGDLRVSR